MRIALGSNINGEDIKEGDDLYIECHIRSNPPFHKLQWTLNVSSTFRSTRRTGGSRFHYSKQLCSRFRDALEPSRRSRLGGEVSSHETRRFIIRISIKDQSQRALLLLIPLLAYANNDNGDPEVNFVSDFSSRFAVPSKFVVETMVV